MPLKDLQLAALRAISNGAFAADALPTRLKLLNWGANDSTKGTFLVTDETLASFAEIQSALGLDRIVLDFEHNTVPGTTEYERTAEPRPIAASGIPICLKDDGIYLDQIDWRIPRDTARNYDDLSPTPFYNAETRVVLALHSAALTRTGSVFDLTFASANPAVAGYLATLSAALNPTPKMETPAKNLIPLSDLLALLGLSANATEADIRAKLTTLTEGGQTRAASPPKEDPRIATLTASLETLTATVKSLADIQHARTQETEAAERARLLADASRDGKIIPLSADRAKTVPLDLLRDMVATAAPNAVPLHARGNLRGDGGKKFGELKGLDLARAAHQDANAADPAYATRRN